MRIRSLLTLALILLFLSINLPQVHALSAYNILGLKRSATDRQVEAKYKKLRSKHRRNKVRKNMVTQAYNQIMVQRKFQIESGGVPVSSLIPEPKHIDQTYVYGYTLNDEYDDGRYFQEHFNQTQHIIERSQNSEENKKTAKTLLFFGSLFLKFLPCIIIYCLCRRQGRGEGGLSQAIARAGNGYANFGRRLRQR